MKSTDELIQQTIRTRRVLPSFDGIPKEVIDYAAGLFDGDGETQIDQIAISQAQKGVTCLHFMYDHFGGQVVVLPIEDEENHQSAYEWQMFGDSMRSVLTLMKDSLLLKKREALLTINYLNMSKDEKDRARDQIKAFKKMEHDLIPETFMPSDAYFGGFSDAEIMLDVHGKTSQHHTFAQAHRHICDAFVRRFGGKIAYTKKRKFSWSIYTFADKFLKTVAPFIVGKKAQVDMILAMKPGEAADIHCKLRELKGNIGFATTKIDRHLAGKGRKFVNPPKILPRGVHANVTETSTGTTTKYLTLLKHKKVDHCLGSFDTVEEAEAQYEKYKRLVEEELRGGPDVDLTFNTREKKKVAPPPPDLVLPSNIFLTKANTFQVRGRAPKGEKKPKQLGTFRTLDEAIAAKAAYDKKWQEVNK